MMLNDGRALGFIILEQILKLEGIRSEWEEGEMDGHVRLGQSVHNEGHQFSKSPLTTLQIPFLDELAGQFLPIPRQRRTRKMDRH